MLDRKPDEMRFHMYKRFIWHKYRLVGKNVRYEIDLYVMELIIPNLLVEVEVGKRKRGFDLVV